MNWFEQTQDLDQLIIELNYWIINLNWINVDTRSEDIWRESNTEFQAKNFMPNVKLAIGSVMDAWGTQQTIGTKPCNMFMTQNMQVNTARTGWKLRSRQEKHTNTFIYLFIAINTCVFVTMNETN